RVREAAKRDPALKFNNLMHHITTDQLHKAYLQLNPKAAAGVDAVTWEQYGKGIQKRLQIETVTGT
ncbi:MAG TPA: group II intron reverse transcriptase/maturase, partial [Firmicutes bacterium]|nr:group II intron reverse transcriptase/maturase [Bacillota bacterium]